MRSRSAIPVLLALIVSAAPAIAQQPRALPGAGPRVIHTPGPLGPAKDAIAEGKLADAERLLEAVRGPDASAARLMLGELYMEQGRYADAEKALQSTGKKVEAAALRADILFRTGKRAQAVKLLEANQNAPSPAVRQIWIRLGEYRIAMGKRADAEAPLMQIVGEYNSDAIKDNDAEGMALVGRATQLLRAWHNANDSYLKSEQDDPANVRERLWHADLLLDKFNWGGAEENVRKALKVAPKDPDALVMLARIKLRQSLDFDTAEEIVKDVLAINPKHAGALAVRAGLAIRDGDIDAAMRALGEGFAAEPDNLELWALKGAARFLADDRPGYEAAKREALARNPQYSRFFTIIEDYAEWEHRYDDIIPMMQEAVKVDPEDGLAWGLLGLTETRDGRETEGLDALHKSWSKDHYNVFVFNTLDLYEKNFASDYDVVASGPFRIRYAKAFEKLQSRYVPSLLGEAWASMKARYGFVPTTPVSVELFEPSPHGKPQDARGQFGVWTSGESEISIQGVCFGHMIGAMGPDSEEFNWGNVLWHELGHVFAIQLSKNHVPRWFTEGLSEYETLARRREWRRSMDPQLYLAITQNRLPAAMDMNRAFTHATSGEDVVIAYYAASQMVAFTAEHFGMPKIVLALKLWGKGVRTPDVIKGAFGVTGAEYDKQYRAWELARLARYKGQFINDIRAKDPDDAAAAVKKHPGDADAHVDYAVALYRLRKADEAQKELAAALKLDPNNMRAHFIAYKVAGAKHDAAGAESHLAAIQKAGGDGYEVRMALADLASEKHDDATAQKQLEAAYRFDPTQSDPLEGLYDLAHGQKREADLLPILRKLAPLDQHKPMVWKLLLRKLVDAKSWGEARAAGESAVFVAMADPEVHLLYAQALFELGDQTRAQFELESGMDAMALQPKPDPKLAARIHRLWAQSLTRQGKAAEAKKHTAEAARLAP